MRVLITGAEGQLGYDLVDLLRDTHEVFPFDLDMDITDHAATLATIEDARPEIVVNCAAYTDVDGCESHSDLAFAVNAVGAQNVAQACRGVGARMVHVSTDFVFDGRAGRAYVESDEVNPMSVYGASKLAGERYVAESLPGHFIVRTAWLYGNHGKNFVKTILKLAGEKDLLTVVDDQVGSPTYSRDLAGKIIELMATDHCGLYHVTNQGDCSWFEFARAILEEARVEGVTVRRIASAELDRPAPRPAYSVLKNRVLLERGIPLLRNWREALSAYFARAAMLEKGGAA